MSRSIEEKQELIDIMFSLVIAVCNSYEKKEKENPFYGKSNLEKAMWVANRLRENGFDTRPVGLSWGVLKEKGIKGIPNHFEKGRKVVIEGFEFKIVYLNDSSITLEPE